jgi:hypothetical protein
VLARVALEPAGAVTDQVEDQGGEGSRGLRAVHRLRRGRRKPGTTAGTRRVLIRFVVASLIVELVLGLGGVVAGREAAKDESTSDARRVTNVLARSVVTPSLTDGLLHSDPAAIRQLDQMIVGRVTGRLLVRVKLWLPRPGGMFQVVYSDEHRLIGSVYQLADDEEEGLREDRTEADLSDVSRPENKFERGQGKLLEVYRPVRTPNGTTLLFETYAQYSTVTARAGRIWREFIPITLGVLLLLQLVQLPLAWSMARRLDGTLRERDRLAQRVADASRRSGGGSPATCTTAWSRTSRRPRSRWSARSTMPPGRATARSSRCSRTPATRSGAASARCGRCWWTSTRRASSAPGWPRR